MQLPLLPSSPKQELSQRCTAYQHMVIYSTLREVQEKILHQFKSCRKPKKKKKSPYEYTLLSRTENNTKGHLFTYKSCIQVKAKGEQRYFLPFFLGLQGRKPEGNPVWNTQLLGLQK